MEVDNREIYVGWALMLIVGLFVGLLGGMFINQQGDIYKKGLLAMNIPDYRLASISSMQNDTVCKTIMFDTSNLGVVSCFNESIYGVFNETG